MRVLIKVGGALLDDSTMMQRCARAVVGLSHQGHQVALVHGGGVAVTRLLQRLGKTSTFAGGLRVTDAETRDVALMVLAGIINKQLVAVLVHLGQAAVGLCGGDGSSFIARKRNGDGTDLGFVGEIVSVNPAWLEAIWSHSAVPVLSSLALGADGEYYNVNADQVAAALAVACNAELLVFLTSVPGVCNGNGQVMQHFHVAKLRDLAESGVVRDGMLPKLDACRQALAGGVRMVQILPGEHVETLNAHPIALGTRVLQ